MSTNPLGRRAPTDWRHVERYPLRAIGVPSKPVPGIAGTLWYPSMDRGALEQDTRGHWWIRRITGQARGGHCYCLKPRGVTDNLAWWDFYNQGQEGACVGFGCSRMMTLLNRKRYHARWHYLTTQLRDEFADTPPAEGTSVRAGLDVLRTDGHIVWRGDSPGATPDPAEGISANRWAEDAHEALQAVGYHDVGYFDILNSWGRSYPHLVRIPAEVFQTLLDRDGEFGIVTDR
jgi:hypothetical protein